MSTFEPEIVAFCCHYCAYTAADMAGTRRISYPSNVKIIRVPCTGKVDAIHLMKALEKGADGVYVAGCLVGDCHFKEGNLRAEAHVEKIKKTLTDLGWEPERVGMMHFSAGMGEGFAKAATEFTEKIKALGPSPASQATSKAV